MFENLITEITSSPLLMRQSAIQNVELLCMKIINGEKIELEQFPNIKYAGHISSGSDYPENPYDSFEENSIAVIPVIGNMFKYGYNVSDRYIPGIDDVANMIRYANGSKQIIGTILLINTPGGTTQSIIQMEDALRTRTKPSVAFIDGQCCSGGIYAASFCNRIVAANRMCEVGSVGTQMTMLDLTGLYANMGIKKRTVRPPKSSFKNTEYEQALAGDDKRLIDESLTPFAEHFQNILKENRPKLDLSVEGLLEGKIFYAFDGIHNGLVDQITNFEGAVRLLHSLHAENQSLYSYLKK